MEKLGLCMGRSLEGMAFLKHRASNGMPDDDDDPRKGFENIMECLIYAATALRRCKPVEFLEVMMGGKPWKDIKAYILLPYQDILRREEPIPVSHTAPMVQVLLTDA